MIWILAVSQVISRINESLFLALAFAGGFAAGNAVGILVERRLAMGTSVVRILSTTSGTDIAEAIRNDGHEVTVFGGEAADGPVTLGLRRGAAALCAANAGAGAFHRPRPHVPSASRRTKLSCRVGPRLRPVSHATGWRAVFKKK